MTGTQNHEGLAGVGAAVEYLAGLGTGGDRRARLRAGLRAIQAYEMDLARRLLEGLAQRPQFKVWGITDPQRLHQRVPTIALTHSGHSAQELAEFLAARQSYAWSGNMYAVELTQRLGLEERGGFLRLGLVHYNTAEEIDRLLHVLDELA